MHTRFRTPISRPALVAVLALLGGLGACSPDEGQTPGQKLDEGIASAKRSGEVAKKESEQALHKAEQGMEDAAHKASAAVSDATITTKVNAALMADDQLKARKIDVDTREGRVVLNGTAPDAAAVQRATTLAQAVDGVRSVENRLTVSKG